MDEDIQFYDDDMFEEIKQQREKADENYPDFKKKNINIGDIILMQFILCVILIISIAVANLIKPEMANNILFNFKQNIDKSFEYKSEISKIISTIVGSVNAKF